jgi:hypothetical protein
VVSAVPVAPRSSGAVRAPEGEPGPGAALALALPLPVRVPVPVPVPVEELDPKQVLELNPELSW